MTGASRETSCSNRRTNISFCSIFWRNSPCSRDVVLKELKEVTCGAICFCDPKRKGVDGGSEQVNKLGFFVPSTFWGEHLPLQGTLCPPCFSSGVSEWPKWEQTHFIKENCMQYRIPKLESCVRPLPPSCCVSGQGGFRKSCFLRPPFLLLNHLISNSSPVPIQWPFICPWVLCSLVKSLCN